MIEKVNILEELVNEYFDKYSQDKLTLLNFLVLNDYKISAYYEHKCRREDIVNELEYCDYDIDRVPNYIIEDMTDYYEEQLSDYGCDCGWHTILNNVLDYFEEDLKEYSNRESEE